VKLPLILIYLYLKLVFEYATAGRNTGCRSVVKLRTLPTHTHLPCIPQKCRDNGNCTVCSGDNDPASCQTRLTRGRVRELKNDHNSVTVQNQTHDYMNFFHHKGLGNPLLQLCPKVVKHPVYLT